MRRRELNKQKNSSPILIANIMSILAEKNANYHKITPQPPFRRLLHVITMSFSLLIYFIRGLYLIIFSASYFMAVHKE